MSCGRRIWTYHAGRKYHNRARAFQTSDSRIIMLEWSDGGEHVKSLGRISRAAAMVAVIEKASELALKAKRAHEPPKMLSAIRADLLRVAALQGKPAGVAPGFKFYERHGRFIHQRVEAAFSGYGGKNPHDTWAQALRQFGLKTARAASLAKWDTVAADVRRVAMRLGNPRRMPSRAQYREHGRWDLKTVERKLGVQGWCAAAEHLGLDIEAHRAKRAAKARKRMAEQREAA